MSYVHAQAFVRQLEEAAKDANRLRKRLDGYDQHLACRVAAALDVMDAILQPTAAELYAAGHSVQEALRTVDRRTQELAR